MKRPKFKLGFELEGFVSRDINISGLRNLMEEFHEDMDTGGEGLNHWPDNNHSDWVASEIRTPPLPWKEAVRLFRSVRRKLCEMGKECNWATTEGCGLHINLSEDSIHLSEDDYDHAVGLLRVQREVLVNRASNLTDRRDCFGKSTKRYQALDVRIDAIETEIQEIDRRLDVDDLTGKGDTFYAYLLTTYPENEALERFSRTGNEYCRQVGRKGESFCDVIEDLPHDNHYNAISKVENTRIEFRCFGNTDYHKRHIALKKSLDEILSAATEAFHRTYKQYTDFVKKVPEQRRAIAA